VPVPSGRSHAVRLLPEKPPNPGQARAIGMATNIVASPDFKRISTVRLPSFWASLTALQGTALLGSGGEIKVSKSFVAMGRIDSCDPN
jgi:hypothetical protein